MAPIYVSRIPEKISEIACGDSHTLVITQSGQVYTMGDNSRGQLGISTTSNKGISLPTFIEDLAFTKMIKIRAGKFSAALSSEGLLYFWGEGEFGKFHSPHLMKSEKKLEISDFQISRGGLAALITRTGQIYSWGPNELGSLGHGDS